MKNTLEEVATPKYVTLCSKPSATGKCTSFTLNLKDDSIAGLIENAIESDPDATDVPVSEVGAAALSKVVDYMKYHHGEEAPIIAVGLLFETAMHTVTNAFDANFIDACASEKLLYAVIYAALYMDIEALLNLALAKLASLIKDKPLHIIPTILSSLSGLKCRCWVCVPANFVHVFFFFVDCTWYQTQPNT